MKIIHTSDWHLGISLHGLSLLGDQKVFIDNFIEILDSCKSDLVIIAGDIFDSSVSNSQAISLYDYAITSICGELGIPAVVISGNHDGAARLASCSSLLEKSGLYVSGKLQKEIKPVCFKDVCVYPLPYFHIDEARSLYPDENITSYNQAAQIVCGNMSLDKSSKNILVSHAFVGGAALSDSDRSAAVGTMNNVSGEVFSGFDYVALGHLHKAQNPAKHVRYSGTPLKYSFSESSHNKSVTLLDTDTMTFSEIPVPQPHELQLFAGSYDELLSRARELSGCEDYIRMEFSDMFPSMETLYTFREYLPNLLSITGIQPDELSDEKFTLSLDEVKTLSPEEMVSKFCSETAGFTPDSLQMRLFMSALDEVQEGVDVQ